MELLTFDDYVTIQRALTEGDEYDVVEYENIYNDNCRYQQGGQVYNGVMVGNGVCFIPEDVAVSENDRVTITLSNARKMQGVVESYKNVRQPLTHERFTRIILKQVKDIE